MPDEKMIYEFMEAMAKAFQNAQKQLAESKSAMKDASKTLGDGGLLGSGGEKFQHAIDNVLQKKIDKIVTLMSRLEKDINKAVQRNKAAVQQSKKGF